MRCLQCGTELIPGITQHVCTNAPRSTSEPAMEKQTGAQIAAPQEEGARLRARIAELEAKGEPRKVRMLTQEECDEAEAYRERFGPCHRAMFRKFCEARGLELED